MVIPAYKRISATFAIGKKKYYGMGIASRDAIYLIMTHDRNDGAAAAARMGGLVGGLIAAAVTNLMPAKTLTVVTTTVAQLPAEVRSHPDWPYGRKPKQEAKQVLVVPRSSVEALEHPSFTNLIKFTIDQTPVTVEYLLFRGAGIRDYLLATGWPVKWKGRVLRHGQL